MAVDEAWAPISGSGRLSDQLRHQRSALNRQDRRRLPRCAPSVARTHPRPMPDARPQPVGHPVAPRTAQILHRRHPATASRKDPNDEQGRPVLSLDHGEVRAAYHACAAFRRGQAIAGQPIPRQVESLYTRLDTVMRSPVSRARHETGCGTGESGAWIGTRLAAEALGWSIRKVQRHAADLDASSSAAGWCSPPMQSANTEMQCDRTRKRTP